MWKVLKCERCGKDVQSPVMWRHLQWHAGEKPCGWCGKLVYGRKKFCDSSCAAKANNNRKGTGVERRCVCGKLVKNKYCSTECQERNEYEDYIERWIGGEVPGGHKGDKGSVSSYVRKWLFERAEGRCEALLDDGSRCGWSRVNPKTGKVPLTVHHKDGHSERHVPDNLELICPCCHSLTPTYGGSNKGNGRKGRKG